jgi:hypothetical protein
LGQIHFLSAASCVPCGSLAQRRVIHRSRKNLVGAIAGFRALVGKDCARRAGNALWHCRCSRQSVFEISVRRSYAKNEIVVGGCVRRGEFDVVSGRCTKKAGAEKSRARRSGGLSKKQLRDLPRRTD